MNARATQERVMNDEGRIGKLESDVRHIQADVTEIKGEVKSLRGAVDLLRTEFLSFKTEVDVGYRRSGGPVSVGRRAGARAVPEAMTPESPSNCGRIEPSSG